MEIDITPTTEAATELQETIISSRGIDCLYQVKLASGEPHTVQFDAKSLDEFQPKRTVSEMIQIWEDGIKDKIDTYTNALKINQHPTNKKWVESGEFKWKYGSKVPVFIETDEPAELDDYDRKGFKLHIHRLNEQKGKMQFIKIC